MDAGAHALLNMACQSPGNFMSNHPCSFEKTARSVIDNWNAGGRLIAPLTALRFTFRGLKLLYVDSKAAGAALELTRLVASGSDKSGAEFSPSTLPILADLNAPFFMQTVAKAHPDAFEVVGGA